MKRLMAFVGLLAVIILIPASAGDIKREIYKCEKAYQLKGWGEPCFSVGKEYEYLFNFEKAKEYYKKSYEDPDYRQVSAIKLGDLYSREEGDRSALKKAFDLFKEACDLGKRKRFPVHGEACAKMAEISEKAGVSIGSSRIRNILLDACAWLGKESGDACFELSKHTSKEERGYILRLMCKNDLAYCFLWSDMAGKEYDLEGFKLASEGICSHGVSSGCSDAIKAREMIESDKQK